MEEGMPSNLVFPLLQSEPTFIKQNMALANDNSFLSVARHDA
jgi:hypothetical protein